MNVMLDLETMDTGSNAAIIAIGAVAFTSDGIAARFYTEINLQSAVRSGGTIDGRTVMWWLKQSDAARDAFNDNDNAPSMTDALYSFEKWFESVGGEQVWGNGAMFDNAILGNAYRRLGQVIPWKFWNDMCYRTVKNLSPDIPLERVGTYHNAVDDAESQALHLIKIMGNSL